MWASRTIAGRQSGPGSGTGPGMATAGEIEVGARWSLSAVLTAALTAGRDSTGGNGRAPAAERPPVRPVSPPGFSPFSPRGANDGPGVDADELPEALVRESETVGPVSPAWIVPVPPVAGSNPVALARLPTSSAGVGVNDTVAGAAGLVVGAGVVVGMVCPATLCPVTADAGGDVPGTVWTTALPGTVGGPAVAGTPPVEEAGTEGDAVVEDAPAAEGEGEGDAAAGPVDVVAAGGLAFETVAAGLAGVPAVPVALGDDPATWPASPVGVGTVGVDALGAEEGARSVVDDWAATRPTPTPLEAGRGGVGVGVGMVVEVEVGPGSAVGPGAAAAR